MKYFTDLFRVFSFPKLILLLIIFLSFNLTAQTPQYYNFENVGSSNNSFPFGQAAGKLVDWLFLPGEINQPSPLPAGNQIIKVYFYIPATNTLSRV